MSENLYWTWLSLRLGDASPYLNNLIKHYESPKNIYDATKSELSALEKIPESVKNRLSDKSLDRAERIIEDCRNSGIGIMTYTDPRYPRVLKYINNPPAVLYFKGKPINFDEKFCVAVVGTRTMSDYGRDMSYKFAYELSSAGAVVISGMALGVDGMAAAGALDAQVPTVVVLGGGIDVVYPKVHKKLYANILREGLLISEYPPGTSCDASHFPKRNRIISGLARCTLVVECSDPSGALITANKAREQGRPVFAIPGAINVPGSTGTNKLIKEGARITTSVVDILDAFEQAKFLDLDISAIGAMNYDAKKAASRYGVESKKDERKIIKVKRAEDFEITAPAAILGNEKEQKTETDRFMIVSPGEKSVYDSIPQEGEVSFEMVCSATGQSDHDAYMHVMSLIVKGAVFELPGGQYRRT